MPAYVLPMQPYHCLDAIDGIRISDFSRNDIHTLYARRLATAQVVSESEVLSVRMIMEIELTPTCTN
jgi:hypothetical protein